MNNRPNTSLIFRSIVEGSGESKASALDWKRRIDEVQERINVLDSSNPQSSKTLAQLKFDLKILNDHTDRVKYWQDPRILILDFIRVIRTGLENYDKQNLVKQNISASRLIEDVKQQVNIIEGIQANLSSQDELRNCYFVLAGLLWVSLDNISTKDNQPLEQSLLLMLCKHRLNSNEARGEYLAFKTKNFMSTLTENQYQEQQIAVYYSAHRELDQQLRCIENPDEEKRKLINQAFNVIIAVKDFQVDCSQFDYKFYTAILSLTLQLVNNPHDQAAKDQYRELTELCEDGKGSLKGKIAGAMLTLMGTIITLSATLALQGGLMPLVPVCIVTGSAMAFSGMTLFSVSTAGGPHKATKQFNSAVKNQPVSAPAVVANERTPLIAPRW